MLGTLSGTEDSTLCPFPDGENHRWRLATSHLPHLQPIGLSTSSWSRKLQ